ncbi:MAG: N-6 DNA methylase [Alphaproteobacteria bacterium]|nr:N-6 DNA methylase [Alphaproteobacteria bacterium]
MNIAQIEENLQQLVKDFSADEFIFDLLRAYGFKQSTITLIKKGSRNLSKKDGQIVLKNKLFFQQANGEDLHTTIDALRKDKATFRHDPRFIIVTDYKTLLAIDTKSQDPLDIDVSALPRHYDFFLPWAGMEKAQAKSENPADVKAAERMAKLYDEILKDNPFSTPEELHSLNIFLSRLLFCFFAEDTDIFPKGSFTGLIGSYTQNEGSDLGYLLDRLFKILNTKERTDEPEYLKAFSYVNGGLFGETYTAPKFSRRSRRMMIECGELDWKEINPDIFGSMIQAVVHADQRGGMGMHYTSVPNIMKVIEPLFLNELHEEFEKNEDNKAKLQQLLERLEHLRIFDPACGSGNFLIIAYKEIRKLEMQIFKRISELSKEPTLAFSRISLSQFYGIELDDFAHEVAILSLWLAEHQMNVLFKETFGSAKPALPLHEGGHIVCDNATRISWEGVCPKDKGAEIYILGNPPYLGAKVQSREQKEDVETVFAGYKEHKTFDYITCWFLKAAEYINEAQAKFAFVSTNSITQGEQIVFWRHIERFNLEIFFAHQVFKWTNNAKKNAGVMCVVVGLRNRNNEPKKLFSNGLCKIVPNINYYLIAADCRIIARRPKPISDIPEMLFGSIPYDGGHLIFEKAEKESLLCNYPMAEKYFRRFIGSNDFINGHERWCLWIEDHQAAEARNIPCIADRLEKVSAFRRASVTPSTQEAAECPHRFKQDTYKETKQEILIVPRVSSERREYLPIAFLPASTIASEAQIVYNAAPFVFAIISSKIHLSWVRVLTGRLKTDIRYSSALCYNAFPIPRLTTSQQDVLANHVYSVLEEREKHSEKTIAQLYDPDKMPNGLREAHRNLDLAVERCYRSKPFTSDEERLEYLFKLYEEMNSQKGTGNE